MILKELISLREVIDYIFRSPPLNNSANPNPNWFNMSSNTLPFTPARPPVRPVTMICARSMHPLFGKLIVNVTWSQHQALISYVTIWRCSVMTCPMIFVLMAPANLWRMIWPQITSTTPLEWGRTFVFKSNDFPTTTRIEQVKLVFMFMYGVSIVFKWYKLLSNIFIISHTGHLKGYHSTG